MTNFLSRLAARSFGVETGVRPRLASIFEPKRGVASPRGSSQVEREIVDEGAEAGERDEIRNRRRPSQPPSPRRAVLNPDSQHEAESPRRRNPAPAKPAIPQNEDLRIELVPPKADPVRQPVPSREGFAAEPRRSQPAAQHPENEQRSEARPPARPAPRVQNVANKPAPSHPVEMDEEHEDRVARDFKPARRPDSDSRQALLQPSPAIAGLAERMRDAASAMNSAAPARGNDRGSDRAAVPAAEPIVHVTIGRVEVRATAETMRESKQRAAAPVMGLDEYLQRQAQRGGQ